MARLKSFLADESSDKPCACGNCEWRGPEKDTLPIEDLDQRIEPGEIVPVGECPECGALVHFAKPKRKRKAKVVVESASGFR